MRLFGALLVIAGLALAFAFPLYQLDYSGTEIARERVFDRADGGWQNGWRSVDVEINENQSPLRIRLAGEILSGEYFLNNTLPLTVDLEGPEGKVLVDDVDINSREDHDSAGSSARNLLVSTTDFGVITSGTHTLTVTMGVERDVSLSWMDAIFVSNVERPDYSYVPTGLGFALLGSVLFLVGGWRKKRARQKASHASGQTNSRWGRQ